MRIKDVIIKWEICRKVRKELKLAAEIARDTDAEKITMTQDQVASIRNIVEEYWQYIDGICSKDIDV